MILTLENFSKNEKTEKLRVLFSILDRDNDGYLELEDLRIGFDLVSLEHVN